MTADTNTRTYTQWQVTWPICGKPCSATYSDRAEADKELGRRKGAELVEIVVVETWTTTRRVIV